MFDRITSEDTFMVIYSPDRYRTQKICDEAIDDCLAALKFIPDWFVTSKILKKLQDPLLDNDDVLFFKEGFNKATFFATQMDIFAVDLDKINPYEDNNFDEDDSDTIIHVRFLAWYMKFEKCKASKKKKAKN